MSLATIASFLVLPDLKVKAARRLGHRGLGIWCSKESSFEVSPCCAERSKGIYDHRCVRIRDEPLRGTPVTLIIKKRRLRCRRCRKVFTEPVAGIKKSGRLTERMRRSVRWAAVTFESLQTVCTHFRLSAKTVYLAFYEHLDLRQRSRTYPLPKAIGIDEHSLRKPRRTATEYATIICDHKNKKVFELVDGRSKEQLAQAFTRVEGTSNVEHVTMDLSSTYRAFVRQTMPKATIIADRFHVQRLFTKKLNRYRKKATGDDRKNPVRKLVLRNYDNLTPEERRAVRVWLNLHPVVREVYEYKEAMRRIYRMKGYDRARKALQQLLDRMGHSKLDDVRSLRRVLLSWRHEILAYHLSGGLSNGRVEGFNRKAKLCQRRAYGYRNFNNYRLRLLDACR